MTDNALFMDYLRQSLASRKDPFLEGQRDVACWLVEGRLGAEAESFLPRVRRADQVTRRALGMVLMGSRSSPTADLVPVLDRILPTL